MKHRKLLKLMESRCLWCGQLYHPRSRPYWAIDQDLRVAGTVHAGHATHWRQHFSLPKYHTLTRMLSATEAHRTAWWRHRVQQLNLRPNLAMTALFRLPKQRRKLMRQWARQNRHLSAEHQQSVLNETEAAEAAYRAEYPSDDDIFAVYPTPVQTKEPAL